MFALQNIDVLKVLCTRNKCPIFMILLIYSYLSCTFSSKDK